MTMKANTQNLLSVEDIEWTLEALPEDSSIEGNASAIDEETDAEIAESIREQLESGNEWAWCVAKVTGKWNGIEISDYLGGCSYKSADDFKALGGYFQDMQEAVRAEIQEHAEAIAEAING